MAVLVVYELVIAKILYHCRYAFCVNVHVMNCDVSFHFASELNAMGYFIKKCCKFLSLCYVY